MLYVHLPFCHTRCQFCEYTVVDPKIGKSDDTHKVYVDALLGEFRLYDEVISTKDKTLVGFDIGGGTPSAVDVKYIEQILEAANKHFKFSTDSMEISIETTPKIAANEPDKIKAYYKMGIRRISMGVQTTDFRQAKELGRTDANVTRLEIDRAVENVRNAGFQSLNLDLMYGFPLRQGREDSWPGTVRDAISMDPDHITLYRMRYKGTSMEHLAPRVKLDQVNQQEGTAREILSNGGYHGLIGKNTYSRDKKSSGCSDYLDKRVVNAVPYLGYGLGAQSFSHHSLAYNLGAVTKKLYQYLRSVELGRLPIQDMYHMSQRASIAKMVSVSFYFGGIHLPSFRTCFGKELEDIFQNEIDFLIKNQLMRYDLPNERLQMTPLGKKHFGGVVAQFYSPSVQHYIVNKPGGEIFEEDPLLKIQRNIQEPQRIPSERLSPTANIAYNASSSSK
jgi:oxygen-independent coproporphyrinogen-3 oxidase